MNLVELLDERARRSPGAPAIIDHPHGGVARVTSFAQLRTRSDRMLAAFVDAGLHAGDGIVILVPMSAELYEVIAAVLRLGAVAVFIDPAHADEQLARCRGAFALRAFVGTRMACSFRLLHHELRAIDSVFVVGGWMPGAVSVDTAQARDAPGSPGLPAMDLADSPAMLTFTAGSTGAAKGVLRSHRLLERTQELLLRHLAFRTGSVNVATMPALVMANLAAGVTSLIPAGDLASPALLDAVRLADSIVSWHAESLVASPCVVEKLAAHCIARGDALGSLRSVVMGGAPVFMPVMQAARDIAPEARVIALYGSTEAEPISVIALDEIGAAERREIAAGAGLPAGRPIDGIQLAVLQDHWGQSLASVSPGDFEAMTEPAGRRGEIVVCGPHVSASYLGGEGDAENKIRVGAHVWHRTGDAGHMARDGRLWLAGRCSQRAGQGERAVYPLMVEAALADEPAIARSAFVQRGGRHLLAVELRPGQRAPAVEYLRQLVPWACIDEVVRLSRIPVDRRHNAKVDYPQLDRLWRP